MSAKPTPQGNSSRIAVEEATAVIGGVPLVNFASFSLEIEDPSTREDTADGNRVHFDQLINPSGSCAVYPTSPSAPRFYQMIQDRRIFNVRYSYPNEDTRGAHTIKNVRLGTVGQEDLSSDGYQITIDWTGDFLR